MRRRRRSKRRLVEMSLDDAKKLLSGARVSSSEGATFWHVDGRRVGIEIYGGISVHPSEGTFHDFELRELSCGIFRAKISERA